MKGLAALTVVVNECEGEPEENQGRLDLGHLLLK